MLALAGAATSGCYEHHLRSAESSACPSPRISGPESGRAGARCDDCASRSYGHAAPFVVRGTLAYRHAHDLEIIDVSDPRFPVVVANVPTVSPRATSLALTRHGLLVGGAFAEVFDLRDPLDPRPVSPLFGAAVGFTVAARGDLAVVVSPDAEGTMLRTFALDDPSLAVPLGSLAVGERDAITHVVLGDGVAWLVRQTLEAPPQLLAVDVRDPRTPVLASSTPLAAPGHAAGVMLLSLHGTRLLVCGPLGDAFGRYFDVTTVAPLLRATRATSPCGILVTADRSIDIVGAARGEPHIALFDLTRPGDTLSLGEAPHEGEAAYAAIVGDALLVSNAEGLIAYPLECD